MTDKTRNEPSSPAKKEHGEGNYAATRQYNEGLKDHVQNHDIEKDARDAAPRTPAEEKAMEEAERIGKSKSRGEDESQTEKAKDGDRPSR